MFEIVLQLTAKNAVGVIPTDTLYGIVASVKSRIAVERLYKLKSRSKPGTVIAANIDQLVDMGLKKSYLKAVKNYWPGPISIVIPCGDSLDYLHLGLYGLAVRIPKNKDVHKLLLETGPLLTSSANLPGQPPATNIDMAKAYFDDKVDFYIDGGDLSKKQPSTIIKMIDDEVEILRQGEELLP